MNISKISAANFKAQNKTNNSNNINKSSMLSYPQDTVSFSGGKFEPFENIFTKLFKRFKQTATVVENELKPIEYLKDGVSKKFNDVVQDIQAKMMDAGIKPRFKMIKNKSKMTDGITFESIIISSKKISDGLNFKIEIRTSRGNESLEKPFSERFVKEYVGSNYKKRLMQLASYDSNGELRSLAKRKALDSDEFKVTSFKSGNADAAQKVNFATNKVWDVEI